MLTTENDRLRHLISILETTLPHTQIKISVSFSSGDIPEQDDIYRLSTAVIVLSKVHTGLKNYSAVSIEYNDITTETFTIGASPKLLTMVCDENGCLVVRGSATSSAKFISKDLPEPVTLDSSMVFRLLPDSLESIISIPLDLYETSNRKDELLLILNGK